MSTVDVCFATYKRPDLLREALQSIAAQNLSGIFVRVIVVDNDFKETARATVEEFRKAVPFEVIYDVEPAQSISMTRNRALDYVQANYFAFLDDDEIASPDWLATILATLIRYEADAVFGPVQRVLPPDAPQWARENPCFQRPRRATGTPVKHGAAGNVLVRKDALGTPPIRFDLAYGVTGGEDADFFYRLHRAGKRMVWCDEAIVTEHVPPNRLTLKWVRQRGFRSGQSFARIFVRRYTTHKKGIWFVIKTFQLLGAVLILPVVRVVSYSLYVRLTVRLMAALGQLSIFFSKHYFEEYHAVRYK